MRHHNLIILFKVVVATSSVALVVVPVFFPGALKLFALAAALAALSSLNTVVTDPLGVLTRQGFRGLYLDGKASVSTAEAAVRKARTSIKVLDTYWGDANHYRSAIQDALLTSPSCRVQVLLAQPGGCIAKVRDSAMRGQAAVDESLPGCVAQLKGLREQINRASDGAGVRITARYYDAVVMGPMIIVDDRHVIVGTFLQSGGSVVTPAFEFKSWPMGQSAVVGHLVTTFDVLWTTSSGDILSASRE